MIGIHYATTAHQQPAEPARFADRGSEPGRSQAARKAGMHSANIMEFEDIGGIIDWLKKNLTSTDAVLIKGSRGLRMERIVAALEVS